MELLSEIFGILFETFVDVAGNRLYSAIIVTIAIMYAFIRISAQKSALLLAILPILSVLIALINPIGLWAIPLVLVTGFLVEKRFT